MRIFPFFALWLLAPTTMLLAAAPPLIQRVVFEGATSEYQVGPERSQSGPAF